MNETLLELTGRHLLLVLLLLGAGAALAGLLLFARRFLGGGRRPERANSSKALPLDALEGVIRSLKEKERTLESLHLQERDRADESLSLSENIIQSLSSGVFTFNLRGEAVNANLPASDVFRRRREEIIGARYADLFASCPELREFIRAALEEGRFVSRAEVELARGGERRWLGVSASPLRNRRDEIIGAICLFTDLTEIRRLQEEMRLQENLARLGEFSAGIAHEFRNGLAAIQGFARLLEREPDSTRAREHGRQVIHETRRLAAVVEDFLNFARPASLRFGPVDLGELVRDCLEEVARGVEDGRVCFQALGEFPAVEGDETLLQRALLNLLHNARDAILAAGRESGWVRVSGQAAAGGRTELVVADNGVGIPPELQERIFLPFFTTRDGGVGLGLALVQKIVLSHGGTVRVSSVPGEGSEFRVTLPLRRRSSPA